MHDAGGNELAHWRATRRLDRMLLRYSVLLVAVLAVLLTGFYQLERLHARALGYEKFRLGVRHLMALQLDEETGLRGFDVTGQRSFLQPYLSARPEVQNALRTLQPLIRGQPADELLLRHFTLLHAAWEQSVAAPTLRNYADPANAVREQAGKRLMDGMRADIAALDESGAVHAAAASRLAGYWEYGTALLIVFCVAATAGFGFANERRSALREQQLLISTMEKRDTAARLSEWRSKVIAMLAHDFKSTLAVVRAYVELLEDYPERRNEEQPYRAVGQAVADLSSMADEALLMARVTSGNLNVQEEPLRIGPLIDEVAERYRNGRQVRVPNSDAVVLGDRAYLRRVFDNLLGNAVKYSPPSSDVDVRILPAHGEVEIAVEDRGEGIEADELPHVFEEYWRSRRTARNSGSGIGLFIVRKIVDAHGGSASIRSRIGAGTTVYVRLRAAEVPKSRVRMSATGCPASDGSPGSRRIT